MPRFAYLTIDDAPSSQFLEKLAFLNELGIKAIWFCQGNFMEARPAMMIHALQTGHVLGNHSYSHPHFSDLTIDQGRAEIRATDAILHELYAAAGVPWTRKYFRFPYLDNGSGSSVMEQLLDGVAPKTPERVAALQAYLGQLKYEQPRFESINYPQYTDYVSNCVDVFGTYDSRDWSLVHEVAAAGDDKVETLLQRMDAHEPEVGLMLNDPGSNDVLVLHDHDEHPENLRLFQAMIHRVLKKGIHFDLPA
jgi:peptidoglycan/xylan/chitin deacetylase (PgdA/CDA1 family)